MSGAQLGHLMLAVSIFAGAVGHTLLKRVVSSVPAGERLILPSSLFSSAQDAALLSIAFISLATAFCGWLGAIRYLDLSYAYAIASASIVVVALLATIFLGETLSLRAWIGLLLILLGCFLVAPDHAAT